jgi:hypothetical protein
MNWRAAGLAALVLLLAPGARAGLLFLDGGSQPLRYGDGFSLGSRFTSNTDWSVIALGLYDTTGNGFLQTHDIGLWDVTAGNVEVAQATMPTGSGTTLIDGFRFVDLGTPVDLVIGHQYILAAYYPSGQVPGVNDQLRDHTGAGSNPTTSSDFSSFSSAYTGSNTVGTLSEPNGFTSGTEYAGPNLEYVPEPRSLALFVTGIALVWLRRGRIAAR